MKLYNTKRSPFGRKVQVAAIERGINTSIETVLVDLTNKSSEFLAANPLGRVPTLVTKDGKLLDDSKLICEYFNTQGEGADLYGTGDTRFTNLNLFYLAEGLIDLLIAILREYRRGDLKIDANIRGHEEAFIRVLEYVNAQLPNFKDAVHIGTINLACALSYSDAASLYGAEVKFPVWKDKFPQLSIWLEQFNKRPSMQATIPVN